MNYIRENEKSRLDLVNFGTIITRDFVIKWQDWLRMPGSAVDAPEPT
jgi:hypothetical protein